MLLKFEKHTVLDDVSTLKIPALLLKTSGQIPHCPRSQTDLPGSGTSAAQGERRVITDKVTTTTEESAAPNTRPPFFGFIFGLSQDAFFSPTLQKKLQLHVPTSFQIFPQPAVFMFYNYTSAKNFQKYP